MGVRVPNYHPSDPLYGKDLIYAHDGVREATRADKLAGYFVGLVIFGPPAFLVFATLFALSLAVFG